MSLQANNDKDLTAKKLREEVADHKRTKDLCDIKLKQKKEIIDLVRKEKVQLSLINKNLQKKLDNVKKDYRSFQKSYCLDTLKQNGQKAIQKGRIQQKKTEREEKQKQKDLNHIKLQEQMKNAVSIRNWDHQNGCSDTLAGFCSQSNFYPPFTQPTALSLLTTMAPSSQTFDHALNHYTRQQMLANQRRMMEINLQAIQQQMEYDFEQEDIKPPASKPSPKKKRKLVTPSNASANKKSKQKRKKLPTCRQK